MSWPSDAWDEWCARWRAACAADAVLAAWAGPWSVGFAIRSGDREARFRFVDGAVRADADDAAPDFVLAAPDEVWARFLAPRPPRHHHSIFALRMRVPEFGIAGDALRFAQFCHLVRRVLDIGRWLARGEALPVPATLRPRLAPADAPRAAIRGGYADVALEGGRIALFHEQSGAGRDVLCLHTAGADGRQFHRLMADPRITRDHRLTAFDLPWHGRSGAPAGAVPGSWALDTDRYVSLIMGFVAAAGLDRPIVLGASMSGEICLELAYRHPDRFRAVVACEASDHIEGRRVAWAKHPQVDGTMFTPEWIEGLMAPDSPAECAAEVLWHYSQGGHGTFAGDILFYSGGWDGRGRVERIDTARCPLFMLTGEYDYSCTAEHSAATAARIPGARFQAMPGLGHFPFAENPARFAEYLLPILEELRGMAD